MKKYLILLCAMLTLGLASCTKEVGVGEIPFNQLNNLPVVTLDINDQLVKFLVDTGSTTTIIDKNLQRKLKFKTYSSDDVIYGIGGPQDLEYVSDINAKYKDKKLDINFISIDLTGLGRTYGIGGILGSDFLESNGYIIDFKNNKLIK